MNLKKRLQYNGNILLSFSSNSRINLYRKKSFDRKPSPGMILKAYEKQIINLKNYI